MSTSRLNARLGARLDPLREPQFRTFLIGYGASALGGAMAPVAITFALLDAGRRASQIGEVFAAFALALGVSLVAAGTAADVLGRRNMAMVGELLGAASQLPLGLLVLTGRPALWAFMALQAVEGVGQALYGTCLAGLIPSLAGSSRLQQANALVGLAASGGAIAGPAVAGLLAATAGPGWAIIANGASCLAGAACLARLSEPGPTKADTAGTDPAEPDEGFAAQVRAGWRVFRGFGWLWPVSVYDALGSVLIFAPYNVLGPVVAKASLGGAGAWGIILAGQGAGAMLGGLVSLWVRPGKPLIAAMIGRLALLAPLLLLIMRAPVPVIVAGACLAGIGFELFLTLWNTTIQRLVPTQSLSRVTAFDWLCITAIAPAGYALVGVLTASFGVNGALWLAATAVAMLSVTVACLPAVRAVRVCA